MNPGADDQMFEGQDSGEANEGPQSRDLRPAAVSKFKDSKTPRMRKQRKQRSAFRVAQRQRTNTGWREGGRSEIISRIQYCSCAVAAVLDHDHGNALVFDRTAQPTPLVGRHEEGSRGVPS